MDLLQRKSIISIKNNGSNGIEYQGDYDNSIDNDTTAVLEEVYDVFGKYSAWGLRNMTH